MKTYNVVLHDNFDEIDVEADGFYIDDKRVLVFTDANFKTIAAVSDWSYVREEKDVGTEWQIPSIWQTPSTTITGTTETSKSRFPCPCLRCTETRFSCNN